MLFEYTNPFWEEKKAEEERERKLLESVPQDQLAALMNISLLAVSQYYGTPLL